MKMKPLTRAGFVLLFLLSSVGLIAQNKQTSETGGTPVPANVDAVPGLYLNGGSPAATPPALWDVQFAYNTTDTTGDAGMAAACFVNNEFWVSRWQNDTLYRFDINGSLISEFVISGITGTRGITTDGTSLYFGNNTTTINVVNPATQGITGTITAPQTVRHIAYDPTANAGAGGLWIGNFNTDIDLIDLGGSTLSTIAQATHGLGGMYGSAWENATAGGPYLWIFHQGGANNSEITRLQLPSGAPTAATHDVMSDIGVTFGLSSGLAGGLFITDQIVGGQWTIGGLIQGTPSNVLFGYELNDFVQPAVDAATTDLRPSSGFLQTPLNHSGAVTFDGIIQNDGSSTLDSVYLNIEVLSGATPVFTDMVGSANLAPAATVTLTSNSWAPSATGPYTVRGWVTTGASQSDTISTNDELTFDIAVTDSTFAREDGNSTGGGYTVSTTDWGYAVSLFTTTVADTLSSVSIRLETPGVGDTTYAVIFATSGGFPSTAIAQGNVVIISAANDYVLNFPGGVALNPGEYAIGVYEGNAVGISLQQSNFLYTQGANFFFTSTNGWSPSNIATARYIRPNFGDPVAVSVADQLEEGVAVWPNPSNGMFNVGLNGGIASQVEVTVTNSIGQVVQRQTLGSAQAERFVIDLSSQTNGMYMIRIDNGDKQLSRKVLVQH